MTDPYAALVRYYDAETHDKEDDLRAYRALLRRFGGPILDIGCGTGRVAFALAEHELSITGIDLSEVMLARARTRAEHEGITQGKIEWRQEDVTSLLLDQRFGLAIFAYNGFMHLLDQEKQVAALGRIARHLKPGGGAVIDIANAVEMFRAEDTSSIVLERLFSDPETGDDVMQQSLASVDRASQIMEVTWIYDRIGPDGLVHRNLVPLTLRYVIPAEMNLMMKMAGFDQIEMCGDYDFSPFEEDSPRLLVIGVKA